MPEEWHWAVPALLSAWLAGYVCNPVPVVDLPLGKITFLFQIKGWAESVPQELIQPQLFFSFFP